MPRLVKTPRGKLFAACEPWLLPKKTPTAQQVWFFCYSYVFRIQRHHRWPCQHFAVRCCWQERSVPSASAVTTLCTWTPQALPTVCKYIEITWDGGWCETTFSPGYQAQLHCDVTVPPVSWQNLRFLFHSDSYDREGKFFSLWLETCLSLCSKNSF